MNFKIFLLALFALDLFSFAFIGKDWSILLLPILFFVFYLFHKFSFMIPFLLFVQHQILVSLFSAHSYYLYFFHLGIMLFFLWKYHSSFVQVSIFYYGVIFGSLGILLFLAQDLLFDFSLFFESIDQEYYMSTEVFIMLTILHIILFSLLFFKGSHFFKKD